MTKLYRSGKVQDNGDQENKRRIDEIDSWVQNTLNSEVDLKIFWQDQYGLRHEKKVNKQSNETISLPDGLIALSETI